MTNSRLTEVFLELVKIEGLSGSEKNAANYIISFLKGLGFSAYEDNSNKAAFGDTGNIICKIGTGGSFVMLSHMDTARTTRGVRPIVHADRITSDGTTILGADNRAGIASILCALEKAIKDKIRLKDFTIAFTTNEETTLSGSKNIELDSRIKMGFVFDSHLRPGNFICESCGAAGFNIRVIGRASHSGLAPEKGIDSISIASKAIADIKLGRLDEESTANIGTIKGGSAVNVVAEETIVEGEVRSMDLKKVQKKLDEIKAKFEKSALKAKGRIEFIYEWDFMPYKISPEAEVYRAAVEVIQSAGLSPRANISWGGSDANSLNERGIECVNLGIGAENPHANDEYILLEDLQKSSEIALELMKDK